MTATDALAGLERHDYRGARGGGADALARFDANVLASLHRHGFVVVENALPGADCDNVLQQMRAYIDATPHGLHGLGGTRRVGALVARSSASHAMIRHPAVLNLARAVLGEQRLSGHFAPRDDRDAKESGDFRYPWQLHLTQIIDVGPGGGTDSLPHGLGMHRANGMWGFDFRSSRLDPQVETMWALTDFTEDNGATHVVLGSHRHTASRANVVGLPTVQAIMTKGSVLVWTGWSVHGAGANRTDKRRVGMNVNYALGFLAQEENQLLACPPHLARKLDTDMQRLIGYRQPMGALNYVAECQSPEDSVLRDDFDVLVPGAHGHAMDVALDGPSFAPVGDADFDRKLRELQANKVAAIAADDLQAALRWKCAISVLRRSPRFRSGSAALASEAPDLSNQA